MEAITAWWSGLYVLNQAFYMAATFFSVFFLAQLAMALIGLGGADTDLDTHVEPMAVHDTPTDAGDSVLTFKLLSVRSIVAFFTLFSWAGALYMNQGLTVTRSLSYALVWGLAAMFVVSYIFHLLRRMTETGNQRITTCVGNFGMVYLDIPAGGQGEIRMPCSGVMTHFKARVAGGAAVKAGTAVRVTRVIGPNFVEVEVDRQPSTGKAPSP
jgi:hypothetical protein